MKKAYLGEKILRFLLQTGSTFVIAKIISEHLKRCELVTSGHLGHTAKPFYCHHSLEFHVSGG